MIYLSEHAILRYRERVKPTLDFRPAKAELETLVRMAGEPQPGLPEWSMLKEQADGHLELSDGIAAVVRELIVTTVVVRGGQHSEIRASRNEQKRKKRAARKRRPRVYSSIGRRQVEPRERWR